MTFAELMGYTAAAYTTFVGYAVMAVAHGVFTKKITEEPAFDYKYLTKSMILLTVSAFVIMGLYHYLVIRWLLAGAVMIFAVLDLKNNFLEAKASDK